MIRDNIDWTKVKERFNTAEPFRFTYVDSFFEKDFAEKLAKSIPDIDHESYGGFYDYFERKKMISEWSKLPPEVYKALTLFDYDDFTYNMRYLMDSQYMWMDIGLHQAGLEIYDSEGELNVSLGYDLHPATNLMRKLNIIVFLEKDWNNDWGGGIEFWEYDKATGKPTEPVIGVANVFNRAVIFEAGPYSWHGLPMELTMPPSVYRKTLNVNFVQKAPIKRDTPMHMTLGKDLLITPIEEGKML